MKTTNLLKTVKPKAPKLEVTKLRELSATDTSGAKGGGIPSDTIMTL